VSLSQAPRARRDSPFLAAKIARLRKHHVAPLNNLLDQIAAEAGLAVPAFDPDSAGIHARSLFLFEPPEPEPPTPLDPVRQHGAARLSAPTTTAQPRTYGAFARLPVWRLPQPRPGTSSPGTSAATRRSGPSSALTWKPLLTTSPSLISLLPDLQVVVTFGDKPRQG